MAKRPTAEVRCEHCREWFRSPIGFSNLNTFDTSTLSGNQVQCPHCRKMTGMNKENLRLRSDEGGFVGDST